MSDPSFFIVKKCQVSRLCLFQKSDRLSLCRLQICIPQQWHIQKFKYRLRKAAAIQTKDTLPSPEIRDVQEFIGQLTNRFCIGSAGGRIVYFALVMDLVLTPVSTTILHGSKMTSHRH